MTSIALSVFELNGQFIEWGDHFTQPRGLTSARWQMLGAISMAPQPPNIPHIAATMGVTRKGVLKQINLFVDEGLVEPQPNPTHKRSPLYSLTKKGQTTDQALTERWQKHVREFLISLVKPLEENPDSASAWNRGDVGCSRQCVHVGCRR
ncbi:MarR family winged helix-turn-helix transcriptional regulator [Pseudomonas sp. PGPR40]|uniref:MarR family winged helix-turn-helix transcriptional regulator n=1 Tax=Pseudomonas sp. PGPR40 TaxID=2913476 RepID=UPI001EDB0787|nr:MarR family winged helix-turn-helix transcriptional regulator [Pseudomonas sp. PGPR40]